MTLSQELKTFEESLLSKIDKKIDNKFRESGKRLDKSLEKKFNQASKDLNQQLKFQTKILEKSFDEKFNEKQRELRDDNLSYKDEIITEVRGLRQEVTVTSGRVTRLEKSFLAN